MNWFKIAKMQNVLFSAELKRAPSGFHYLDIPESLTTSLWGLLPEGSAEKTPYKNKEYSGVGAHVSVIGDKELEGKDIDIKEVGSKFDFSISDVKSTNPEGWDEMSKVYFVQIECDELKKMRARYGLPKTYNGKGHKFHITFALEKR